MTHPLVSLTEQEIYNKAVEGIASQNWERSVGSEYCRYTIINESGNILHCALGWIDPNLDDDYVVTADAEDFFVEGIREPFDEERADFLYFLQDAHDSGDSKKEMVAQLVSVAKRYDLEIPECLLEQVLSA